MCFDIGHYPSRTHTVPRSESSLDLCELRSETTSLNNRMDKLTLWVWVMFFLKFFVSWRLDVRDVNDVLECI